MLTIENLSKNFGGFQALNDISLSLKEGEKHAILGPNGAGKSTFFNCITGQLAPTSGKVHYKGKPITGYSASRIVKLGIARSFQRINIYPKLTVFENVQVAFIADGGMMFNLFSPGAQQFRDETRRMLQLVNLSDDADRVAGLMSYGKQ